MATVGQNVYQVLYSGTRRWKDLDCKINYNSYNSISVSFKFKLNIKQFHVIEVPNLLW